MLFFAGNFIHLLQTLVNQNINSNYYISQSNEYIYDNILILLNFTFMKNKASNKTGIAIGIGIGTAIGVALDNIAIGVAIGAALGITLEMRLKKNTPKKKGN